MQKHAHDIHHHHLPPKIRSFYLFRHRLIAIVSWGVHDLFFLEVCSWGRVSAVWCCPFFQGGRSSFVCIWVSRLVFQRSPVFSLWLRFLFYPALCIPWRFLQSAFLQLLGESRLYAHNIVTLIALFITTMVIQTLRNVAIYVFCPCLSSWQNFRMQIMKTRIESLILLSWDEYCHGPSNSVKINKCKSVPLQARGAQRFPGS